MTPSKSLFPLPLPYFGIFRALSPQVGSAARSRLGVKRAVFVTVAALNYLHAGSRPVAHRLLRRPPNQHQSKALGYIERLVRSEKIKAPGGFCFKKAREADRQAGHRTQATMSSTDTNVFNRQYSLLCAGKLCNAGPSRKQSSKRSRRVKEQGGNPMQGADLQESKGPMSLQVSLGNLSASTGQTEGARFRS